MLAIVFAVYGSICEVRSRLWFNTKHRAQHTEPRQHTHRRPTICLLVFPRCDDIKKQTYLFPSIDICFVQFVSCADIVWETNECKYSQLLDVLLVVHSGC